MSQPLRVLAPPTWSAPAGLRQLTRVFSYWDLLVTLSCHRINVRYKQSLLGGLWAILQPVAMMVVFTAVFSRLVKVPSDGVPYALFAYSGLLPWTFFSGAVSSATSSMVSNSSLITKVYFPRELLPISYVVASAVDLFIGSTVLLSLAIWYRVPLTRSLVMVVPIVILIGTFALSCSLVLSAIHVRFRDVGMALPIGLQLLMFASPVLYSFDVIPPAWRAIYLLNPLAGLIDAFRRSVLGLPVLVPELVTASLVTAVALPFCYILFKHAEATMADVV